MYDSELEHILYALWITSFFRSSWVSADSIYNISVTVPRENSWIKKKPDIDSQHRSQSICTLIENCLEDRDYGWAARALHPSSAFGHSFQCKLEPSLLEEQMVRQWPMVLYPSKPSQFQNLRTYMSDLLHIDETLNLPPAVILSIVTSTSSPREYGDLNAPPSEVTPSTTPPPSIEPISWYKTSAAEHNSSNGCSLLFLFFFSVSSPIRCF